MFLFNGIVRNPQLFSFVFLSGIDALLTVVLFFYISKNENLITDKNNIYYHAMLTAY